MATTIFANQALTPMGWLQNITVEIDHDGVITDIVEHASKTEILATADHHVGILLPAMSNVHSQSFQRAMAGSA